MCNTFYVRSLITGDWSFSQVKYIAKPGFRAVKCDKGLTRQVRTRRQESFGQFERIQVSPYDLLELQPRWFAYFLPFYQAYAIALYFM